MPRLTCPVRAAVSPRSARRRMTMAVLDRASRQPVNAAFCTPTPRALRAAVVAATVRVTCRPPPRKIRRAMRVRRSRLNSMPMVNSSSITPISDAALMRAGSRITPSAPGPASTPASRNPMIGMRRSRKDRYAATADTISSSVSCSRNSGGPLCAPPWAGAARAVPVSSTVIRGWETRMVQHATPPAGRFSVCPARPPSPRASRGRGRGGSLPGMRPWPARRPVRAAARPVAFRSGRSGRPVPADPYGPRR